jgi:hypothetical protein
MVRVKKIALDVRKTAKPAHCTIAMYDIWRATLP